MIVFVENFGSEYLEDEILLYTFMSKSGMKISITNFGGIITSIMLPDKNNRIDEVTMGFDNLQSYINTHPYFGCIVGRYANRIGGASFLIDGVTYKLSGNNEGNHLHGGFKGFDKKIWNPILEDNQNSATLKLFYLCRDMEEGFPGNLLTSITYKIYDDNSFEIHFQATTDKATHVNLTSHCYFNLNGFEKDILDHSLTIDSDQYLLLNNELIPTGEYINVENTPYDFRRLKTLSKDIHKTENGYDICFVLSSPSLGKPSAIVEDRYSGRFLKIYTTQPGLQLYTSNFLDGTIVGNNNTKYFKHNALCLETQHFPDSPNKQNFPTTLLRPNEEYYHVTRFEFGVKP